MDVRRSNPRSWRTFALFTGATLPFLAAIGFNAVDRPARLVEAGPTRPALVFDQYLVNRGEIRNSPVAEAHYCFKNCGKDPVRITHLEPSCGCMNTRIEMREYQPGEICEFTMNVLTTREKPGSHEYELRIDYEDPAPRSATVVFKFALRREVAVRPSQLIFYQNDLKESQQTVVVSDMREKPFHITGTICTSPLVKVKLGESIDDAKGGGGRETSVSITVAPKTSLGKADTWVTLLTDDPKFSRIPIALMIRDVNVKRSTPAEVAVPAARQTNPAPKPAQAPAP